ncbi:MAG TPA: HlyD family efflux transporter periplasmic adaptor subunit [Thermoanaerobaculia bacterium]|nr:HlyD family efflux transporter periplasmic adaptor subunit [Thermoanaerobaculia bacterium]
MLLQPIIMRMAVPAAVSAIFAAACFSGYTDSEKERELRVRRGAFRDTIILTGELEAARGAAITVPTLPNWQTSIKWVAVDGAAVKQGERVVELDNSAFTTDLDSKRQNELQAIQELQQKEEEWKAAGEDKRLEFEKRSSELEKARIEAAVPRDILSEREYEDRQTQLLRARVEFEKARDILDSQRAGIDSDRRNLRLRLGKAQREIQLSERAISALVLHAPRDGIVVLRDHPWEGRKVEVNDTVFVGFALAVIPELESLQVTAALADVDDGRIGVGMPAVITLDGYPSMSFNGKVSSISAVAQESARQSLRRAFRVVVTLDQIDEGRMRPGLSARVEIGRHAAADVLIAPRAALSLDGPTPRARLAAGRAVDVKLGACSAQECIVTGGLKEGQRLGAFEVTDV